MASLKKVIPQLSFLIEGHQVRLGPRVLEGPDEGVEDVEAGGGGEPLAGVAPAVNQQYGG